MRTLQETQPKTVKKKPSFLKRLFSGQGNSWPKLRTEKSNIGKENLPVQEKPVVVDPPKTILEDSNTENIPPEDTWVVENSSNNEEIKEEEITQLPLRDISLEDRIDQALDTGSSKKSLEDFHSPKLSPSDEWHEEPKRVKEHVDEMKSPEPTQERTDICLKARQIFDGSSEFDVSAASWLGDSGEERAAIRKEFMQLFDWTGQSILHSLRGLCSHIYMKAESQQLDRLIDSFSDRWIECNPNHGFKSAGVVYTMAYSILLLNTDLHSEEYTNKMPKAQYVQQTLTAVKGLLQGEETNETKSTSNNRFSFIGKSRISSGGSAESNNDSSVLVNEQQQATHTPKEFEHILTNLLKDIYTSIDTFPLNLGNRITPHPRTRGNSSRLSFISYRDSEDGHRDSISGLGIQPRQLSASFMNKLSRRSSWFGSSSSSVLSNEMNDYNLQELVDSRSVGGRLTDKGLSRNRHRSIYGAESFGFFGALRNTIIREDAAAAAAAAAPPSSVASRAISPISSRTDVAASTLSGQTEEGIGFSHDDHSLYTNQMSGISSSSFTGNEQHMSIGGIESVDQIETDVLALNGPPWAKEGLLKFQVIRQSSISKIYRRREWNQGFVVVDRGQLKIFKFDKMGHTSMYSPPRGSSDNIGDGNWLNKAIIAERISLAHCLAQVDKTTETFHVKKKRSSIRSLQQGIITSHDYHGNGKRPYIDDSLNSSEHGSDDATEWSLVLPNRGGTVLFLAGTEANAQEFVDTCNYWAAKTSREPLVEAVSSVEYGWNGPLQYYEERLKTASDNLGPPKITISGNDGIIIHNKKFSIKEWTPPVLSSINSSLGEVDQLDSLNRYVRTVEQSLVEHNQSRKLMITVFKSGNPVSVKAHSNWERKSQYLLNEIVKYGIYITNLERAITLRETTLKGGIQNDENNTNNDPSVTSDVEK